MAGLYGDWEEDMGQEEPKYKGYKSDIAFMKAQKKKKAAKKKKQSGSQRSSKDKFQTSEAYLTREIKQGDKVVSREPYKVIQGDSPEMKSYAPPKKEKKKKKARRVLGRVAR